jgi:hypothetical protein
MIVAAGMINCALDSATKRISPYKRGRSKGKPVLLHAVTMIAHGTAQCLSSY